MLKMIN